MLVNVCVLERVTTSTPSIVTTPAAERAIVVSVACPSSILPTPIAVEVEAVIPLTGNPVQLVNVPELGVPRTGVVSVGLVNVLLVNVSVPAIVARVPVVGKVTLVLPEVVKVVVCAPEVVKLPPIVIVLPVFATPVPPYCPAITEAFQVPVVKVPTEVT